jgi:hypothetical protein
METVFQISEVICCDEVQILSSILKRLHILYFHKEREKCILKIMFLIFKLFVVEYSFSVHLYLLNIKMLYLISIYRGYFSNLTPFILLDW